MVEFAGRELTAEAILRVVDKSYEGLKSAEKNLAGTQARMMAMSKKMMVVGGALTAAVTLPILAWAKEMTKAQIEEEKQLNRVRIHLQAVQKQTRLTVGQFEDMAKKLSQNSESVSDFGDVMTENLDILAKFGNIHGKTFSRAAQLVQDVSAGMNKSLGESAEAVGRALNNPIASLRMLREMGVDFDAQTKKRLQDMDKSGQRARVMQIILQALERRWHGQARALTQTTAGQIQLIGKNMEEFGKNVNKNTMMFIDPYVRRLRKWSEALKDLPDAQQKVIWKMLALAASVGPSLLTLGLLSAAITKIGAMLRLIVLRLPWLLALASLVEAVGDKWGEVVEKSEKAAKAMTDAAEKFQKGKYGEAAKDAGKAFGEFYTLQNDIFNKMLENIPLIGPKLAEWDAATNKALDSVGTAFWTWGTSAIGAVQQVINALDGLVEVINKVDRSLPRIATQLARGKIEVQPFRQKMETYAGIGGRQVPVGHHPSGEERALRLDSRRLEDSLDRFNKTLRDQGAAQGRGTSGKPLAPPLPRYGVPRIPPGMGRASGGATSGWAMTGERGPELAYHGQGWIHTADKLQAIMTMLTRTAGEAIRPNPTSQALGRVAASLDRMSLVLGQVVSHGTGGGGASGGYGAGSGGLGYGGTVGGGGPGSVGSGLTYRGIGGRIVPIGHHPAMGGGAAAGGPGTPPVGAIPGTGATAPAGTYRKQYQLGAADLDRRVINTIAGEAYTKNPASVDAVINNMLNRVGTKHAWGPDANLLQVARARGQYAGYRNASEKEAAFIAERMRLVASGGVPDPTHGANTYRAAWYGSPSSSKWFRKYGQFGTVVGGNRFAYDPAGGRSPYSPFDERTVAANLARARSSSMTADSAAGDRRSIGGKGKLDVNIRVNGPAHVERVRSTPPEGLELATGVDRTGARFHRPGGLLGPV